MWRKRGVKAQGGFLGTCCWLGANCHGIKFLGGKFGVVWTPFTWYGGKACHNGKMDMNFMTQKMARLE